MAFDRRQFLILVGGAAAFTALRPSGAWAKRAGDLMPLQPWSVSPDPPATPVEIARGLIGAAVLAPSDWNTQPWRFEVEENVIRLAADPKRALPITDPDRRGMMIALGAALENMLVAARAWGLRPSVIYLPHEGANDIVAEVSWTGGDPRRDRAMFLAIPERRTNRRDYDERGLFPQNRAALTAQVPEGMNLHWIDDGSKLKALGDLVHDAVHRQVSDARAQAEQYGWMRFDDGRDRGDGVPVESLELGGPAGWFAGRYFNPQSMFIRFGAEYAGKQARGQVRTSGAVVLLTATGNDEATRLMGGQALQRIALKATQLGIAHHVISAPIEVDRARGPLLSAFGVAGDEQPLAMIRLGHAHAPKPTPRRGVTMVASFRTT